MLEFLEYLFDLIFNILIPIFLPAFLLELAICVPITIFFCEISKEDQSND